MGGVAAVSRRVDGLAIGAEAVLDDAPIRAELGLEVGVGVGEVAQEAGQAELVGPGRRAEEGEQGEGAHGGSVGGLAPR